MKVEIRGEMSGMSVCKGLVRTAHMARTPGNLFTMKSNARPTQAGNNIKKTMSDCSVLRLRLVPSEGVDRVRVAKLVPSMVGVVGWVVERKGVS